MTLECNNNCRIKGNIESLVRLNQDLINSNFSMNSIIPVEDIEDEYETAEKWGTGSVMELDSSIFSAEEPSELMMSFRTDSPIEQFFRHVSEKYEVSIDYAYYNSVLEFVGLHHYDKGVLKSYKYNEEPNDKEYEELVLGNNFTLPKKPKAYIISFKELINKEK